MHEYDIALKSLLMRPGGSLLPAITGLSIERWHNVELPEVRNLRVDLLGETASGALVHIELQRANDPAMIWCMAEYAFSNTEVGAMSGDVDQGTVDLNIALGKVRHNLKAAIDENNASIISGPLPTLIAHEAHFVSTCFRT
jgi:hypothetical protein